MEYIKAVFINRKLPFYFSLGSCVLALLAAICYAGYFYTNTNVHLAKYVSWMPTVFALVGVVLYLCLTMLKQSRIGTALLAFSSFASFISYISTIYGWPVEQIMVTTIDKIPEFPMIITVAVLLLLSFIIANVTAWQEHDKKEAK